MRARRTIGAVVLVAAMGIGLLACAPLTSVVQIAAGEAFTCALRTDGTVSCWGDAQAGNLGDGTRATSYAATAPVAGITTAVAITTGKQHACALLSDGTVRCWGAAFDGQLGDGSSLTLRESPVVVSGLTDVTSVSAGEAHTCATKSDGTAWCWGRGGSGQLGGGSTSASAVPVQVTGLTTAVEVAAGANHSCAVLDDRTVRCWGRNNGSQLGDGTTTNATTPVAVSGLAGVAEVTAGTFHTCARLDDGSLRCWGFSGNGQTGTGSTTNPVPAVVTEGGIARVDAGAFHTCAVLDDGTASCWGFNGNGRLGVGDTVDRPTPTQVLDVDDVTDVDAGAAHTADARVACWGFNGAGNLGDTTRTDQAAAVPVAAGPSRPAGIVGVGSGSLHSCAVQAKGRVLCWGQNSFGQLGDGTFDYRSDLVEVTGITDAVAIAVGTRHSCAVLADTTARCWGEGFFGELGDGTSLQAATPVAVAGLSGIVDLAAGEDHTCAALDDGTARCWGRNAAGQLGDGTTTDAATPVAVSGLTDVTSVTAGLSHSCATLSSGGARCWGANASGQLGDGTTTGSATPVAVSLAGGEVATAVDAGDNHSCAIVDAGGVRCWGRNNRGQLGNGTTTASLTPVPAAGVTDATGLDAGQAMTCAALASGEARCWGINPASLGDGTFEARTMPVAVLESRQPITPVTGVSQVTTGLTTVDAGNTSSGRDTCAIVQRRVRCWGLSPFGLGGDNGGTVPLANRPVVFPPG